MGKESKCPGCKKIFENGRPYSMHIASCKDINSAADTALKKHKIIAAKKLEKKKAEIAARKELAAQAAQASSSQMLPDSQDVDVDMEVSCERITKFKILVLLYLNYRIFYSKVFLLLLGHQHRLQDHLADLVDECADRFATVMTCQLTHPPSLFLRNPRKKIWTIQYQLHLEFLFRFHLRLRFSALK